MIYNKSEKKSLLVIIYKGNNLFYFKILVLISRVVVLFVELIIWLKYFLFLYSFFRSICRCKLFIFCFLVLVDFEVLRECIFFLELLIIVFVLVIFEGFLRDYGMVWCNLWCVYYGGVCFWLIFFLFCCMIVKKGLGEFCCKMGNIYYMIFEFKIFSGMCLLIKIEINNLYIF